MSGIKRSIDGTIKRKHVALPILQKIILKKLDCGSSVNVLASLYGISPRTIYDIRKNKEKIMKFFANTDCKSAISKRKSMHAAKSASLDDILYEWFRQRRSEGIPMTGPLLCEKAKELHKDLAIEESCNFSTGWLTRFKERHGIRYLKACGDKLSGDNSAAEDFIDEFSNLIKTENITPEQIYNMDETGLFWRCLPRKTLVTQDESGPSSIKEAKDRITVIVCSNAAGTHNCKLTVIGKSAKPRSLRGLKKLPVFYTSNKKAWATQTIIQDWFESKFVPEARAHCKKIGLEENCKIILLLDNCAAHPHTMEKENVSVVFLPPNTTSLIQPMDQGIINSMKCHYRSEFLRKLIMINPSSGDMLENYKKNFTIKDCLFLLDEAWKSVSTDTLINAWHNLWPESLFIDSEETTAPDFDGFRVSQIKAKAAELLTYAKHLVAGLDEEEIINWMECSDEIQITEHITDDEIISGIIQSSDCMNSDTESEEGGDRISIDEGLNHGNKYLDFIMTQTYGTDQELLTVRRLQDKILKHKMSSLKQTTIDQMFKKFS